MDEKAKVLGESTFLPKGKKAGRKQLRELVESQEYRCALSGIKLTPDTAELDHKLAVANGGDHSIENLQVVYFELNRMKAAMSNDRFIELCKLVARWNS